MKAPTRILVPIDMSVFSVTALQYAQDIAEHFGAEILVLHIAEEEDVAARISKKEREQMSRKEIDDRLKAAADRAVIEKFSSSPSEQPSRCVCRIAGLIVASVTD